MNKKISDLFDLGDEIVVTPRYGKSCDPAEIKELVMKRIQEAKTANAPVRRTVKKARPAWRGALIAAVLALTLAGTALAVYQHTMADRSVTGESSRLSEGSYQQYSPVGFAARTETPTETPTETSNETSHFIENNISPADSTNREYLALKEWLDYMFNCPEEDMDVLLDQSSPYRYYGIGWEGMARHLQAIADKYGLRLYESQAIANTVDDFFALLDTAPFLTVEPSCDGECSGMVFDDGSFILSGVRTSVTVQGADTSVSVNIDRAAKGSFCSFLIAGDEPEEYAYEEYTTAGGQRVDLALGSRYSFLFAELQDCWVTVDVNGGTVGSEYLPVIDMDALRQIADSIDFPLLAIDPDPAGSVSEQ